jgi:hypothetical protein
MKQVVLMTFKQCFSAKLEYPEPDFDFNYLITRMPVRPESCLCAIQNRHTRRSKS